MKWLLILFMQVYMYLVLNRNIFVSQLKNCMKEFAVNEILNFEIKC